MKIKINRTFCKIINTLLYIGCHIHVLIVIHFNILLIEKLDILYVFIVHLYKHHFFFFFPVPVIYPMICPTFDAVCAFGFLINPNNVDKFVIGLIFFNDEINPFPFYFFGGIYIYNERSLSNTTIQFLVK